MRVSLIGLSLLWIAVLSSCDTGFGQPCTMPVSPEVSNACTPPPMVNDDQDDDETEQVYKVTCAVDNYPTCSTMSCLVYRGSSPFCSQRCSNDSDCFGSGKCCPLFGECNTVANAYPMSVEPQAGVQAGLQAGVQAGVQASPPQQVPAVGVGCGEPGNPCYCIRQKDFEN